MSSDSVLRIVPISKPTIYCDNSRISSHRTNDDSLSKPIQCGQCFDNPWEDWNKPGPISLLKWQLTKCRPQAPSEEELDKTLPLYKINWKRIKNIMPSDEFQVTWMGHATFLIQTHQLNILTDPVWKEKCSPLNNFIGPSRIRDPPCELEELPKIDIILISHNHYDHLEESTVEFFRNDVLWMIPSGMESWFTQREVHNFISLEWWESYSVSNTLRITSLPAQHWSQRNPLDAMKSLWCSWAIDNGAKKCFFVGDTGYCDAFKEIGKTFGSFDLSLIPIGAYEPRWMMKSQHVDPQHAVDIHLDVKSKMSIGMHWGTWILSDEHVYSPPVELYDDMVKRGLNPLEFVCINHGRSFDTLTGVSFTSIINSEMLRCKI